MMTSTRPEPRHRKNAAEWLMWIALWPIAWAVKLVTRLGTARH